MESFIKTLATLIREIGVDNFVIIVVALSCLAIIFAFARFILARAHASETFDKLAQGLSERLDKKEEQHTIQGKALAKVIEERESDKRQIEQMQEQSQLRTEKISKLELETAALKQKSEEVQKVSEAQEARIQVLETENKQQREEIGKLKQQLEDERNRHKLVEAQYKSELESERQRNTKLENELATSTAKILELEARIAQLERDLNERSEQLNTLVKVSQESVTPVAITTEAPKEEKKEETK